MPVHKTTKGGKPAMQWGNHGKKYVGPGAAKKAQKQAAAAYANGYKGKKGLLE